MVRESTETAEPQRSWVLPDEPVAVRLMNTIWADRTGVHDDLCTTGDLSAWLASTGATDGRAQVNGGDVARARRLRDALRRLAALCTEDTRRAAASAIDDVEIAISEINAAIVASPPAAWLALAEGRLYRDTALVGPPVTAALSAVATDAIELFTGGGDSPVRACQAPRCVLYFVKNHPRREWCSSACGNRARAARYYTRHRLNDRVGTGA